MSGQNLHEGHRARLREKFARDPEILSDHELLELLLYYSVPRKNTNPIAHDLLHCFQSLSGVVDASVAQLRSVGGIGDASAMMFPVIKELFFRYMREVRQESEKPRPEYDAQKIGDFFLSEFVGLSSEKMIVIGLNRDYQILGWRDIGTGDKESVSVNTRQLSVFVSEYDPRYLVLAHNHPSKIGLPSRQDVMATNELKVFARRLQTHLIDHIIYDGAGDFTSFYQSGGFASGFPDYRVSLQAMKEKERAIKEGVRLEEFVTKMKNNGSDA